MPATNHASTPAATPNPNAPLPQRLCVSVAAAMLFVTLVAWPTPASAAELSSRMVARLVRDYVHADADSSERSAALERLRGAPATLVSRALAAALRKSELAQPALVLAAELRAPGLETVATKLTDGALAPEAFEYLASVGSKRALAALVKRWKHVVDDDALEAMEQAMAAHPLPERVVTQLVGALEKLDADDPRRECLARILSSALPEGIENCAALTEEWAETRRAYALFHEEFSSEGRDLLREPGWATTQACRPLGERFLLDGEALLRIDHLPARVQTAAQFTIEVHFLPLSLEGGLAISTMSSGTGTHGPKVNPSSPDKLSILGQRVGERTIGSPNPSGWNVLSIQVEMTDSNQRKRLMRYELNGRAGEQVCPFSNQGELRGLLVETGEKSRVLVGAVIVSW